MAVGFVLAAVALTLVIYRQVVPRRVSSSSFRIVAIFAIIGIAEAVQYFRGSHPGRLTLAGCPRPADPPPSLRPA
jgi:hypothetical protein